MSFIPQFEDAKRVQCKASIAIDGLSSMGKTGLALITGFILADKDWKKLYAVDTENRSMRLYVDLPSSIGGKFGSFKVMELTPDIGYAPSNYLAIRDAAVNAGAKCFIQDSISHAWAYKGGVLDMVSEKKATTARYQRDSYAAWGDEEVMAEKNRLLDLVRDHRIHVISTLRVKEKLEYTKDAQGKSVLESLGEQQIQQAELKYEFDLVLSMVRPGDITDGKVTHPKVRVVKSRYAILKKDQEYEWTPELLQQLKTYLEEGVDPETIFEEQRQEYLTALKEIFTKNASRKPIADAHKANLGYENSKYSELPLSIVKQVYIGLSD